MPYSKKLSNDVTSDVTFIKLCTKSGFFEYFYIPDYIYQKIFNVIDINSSKGVF